MEGKENKEKLLNHRRLAPPSPEIVPVSATLSTHFSDRGFTIVSFAKMLIGKNAAFNETIELNRSDVTIIWEVQVRYAFARYTPERNFYLDQVSTYPSHGMAKVKEVKLTDRRLIARCITNSGREKRTSSHLKSWKRLKRQKQVTGSIRRHDL